MKIDHLLCFNLDVKLLLFYDDYHYIAVDAVGQTICNIIIYRRASKEVTL